MSLDTEELIRYGRHLAMPQVGSEGQSKLKNSKVLLVGAGGLGSPVALYLAAAGVGHLRVVDGDRVDVSNLQRQVLYGTPNLGEPKVEVCKRRLEELNPLIEIEIHREFLSSEKALHLLSDVDLVVDGTDNFATRYLVNDACVLAGVPYVYGSVFQFQGQVSLFAPCEGGPCYRCLYPEPPPAHLAPSCAEGGVLGVLPGVVGTLQATEAVKYILGVGDSLLGRLLTFDALKMKFREWKFAPNPACPLCGEEPSITELIDYGEFCAGADLGERLPEMDPVEFQEHWSRGWRPVVLDVRQPHEWEICNLASYGAELCPLPELEALRERFPKDQDILVLCRSGVRGRKAQESLGAMGFARVTNLTGGILAWCETVDPAMRKY